MTPTLLGRWQTRLLLFMTVGVLITSLFADVADKPFFQLLFWILAWGFLWDVLYTFIQKFRWDRDWPAVYQVAAGIWEAFFLLTFIYAFGLFGSYYGEFSVGWFLAHYCTVWLGIFLASQVLMRLLFPRWRFRGGRWL
ncbi:MAG: hypothetical protein AAFU53_05215 [Cyanobacteria bacterium J06632_3]